jgi:hypothetical protein
MKPNPLKTTFVILLRVLLVLPILSVISCASQPKIANHLSIESVIVSKLGSNYTLTENKNNTFVLCQQKPEGDHAARNFKYIVIRKSDNQIVLSGSYQLGYVKWISNEAIEVLSLPSILEQDESKFKKVFSVNENQPNLQ